MTSEYYTAIAKDIADRYSVPVTDVTFLMEQLNRSSDSVAILRDFQNVESVLRSGFTRSK